MIFACENIAIFIDVFVETEEVCVSGRKAVWEKRVWKMGVMIESCNNVGEE